MNADPMDTDMEGHHSLVTPIDWKLAAAKASWVFPKECHHSLVTPIDWKPLHGSNRTVCAVAHVTTRW